LREASVGDACRLKQTSLARNNADKIDADKLRQALEARALSGARQIAPAAFPRRRHRDYGACSVRAGCTGSGAPSLRTVFILF
jgi:hypothetical protein